MRPLIVIAALLLPAGAVQAAATCSPVSTRSAVLASADREDIHPDWSDGSTIGLSWSLDLQGDEQGTDGEYYLIGDLIDPRGNVVTRGVYADAMEWECDSDD